MRVLVVDDDEAIVAMLSRYLLKQGFEVETAADALQALERVEQKQIDLVITDLMMPRMDGRELVRRLRIEPKTRELPIIMMTAYPSDHAADASLREGASFFLPKPLDLDALATLIHFAK
jgi:two-component system chemotaxis response regulator CheY